MAKERGTLSDCVLKTIHHAETGEHAMVPLLKAGELNHEYLEYRFQLIRSNLKTALAQIEKIESTAKGGDMAGVQKLLIEKTLEFGHNFGE